MDLPEGMRRVSREPKMVNQYMDYVQVMYPYILWPDVEWILQYSIPDDGYTYQLAEIEWYSYGFSGYEAYAGPIFVNSGFALDQDDVDWNWISGGWCQHHVRHVPAKQGMLAQRYPGAYGAYSWNPSGGYITIYVVINMYKKWVES